MKKAVILALILSLGFSVAANALVWISSNKLTGLSTTVGQTGGEMQADKLRVTAMIQNTDPNIVYVTGLSIQVQSTLGVNKTFNFPLLESGNTFPSTMQAGNASWMPFFDVIVPYDSKYTIEQWKNQSYWAAVTVSYRTTTWKSMTAVPRSTLFPTKKVIAPRPLPFPRP